MLLVLWSADESSNDHSCEAMGDGTLGNGTYVM
jgi:hypothetical protein